MSRIIGLMVVKDEADILPRTLDAFATWLDGIVVIDNGSTDQTLSILQAHPLVKKLASDPTEFDESYFVPKLLALAEDLQADWYVECDADEIFDPQMRQAIESAPQECNVVTVNIRYMLDDHHYYRENTEFSRAFRNKDLDCSSIRKLHNSKIAIPVHRRVKLNSGLTVKHFQIRSYEQGMRKYRNYLKLDPQFLFQKSYEHLAYLAKMFETKDFRRLPLRLCK